MVVRRIKIRSAAEYRWAMLESRLYFICIEKAAEGIV